MVSSEFKKEKKKAIFVHGISLKKWYVDFKSDG